MITIVKKTIIFESEEISQLLLENNELLNNKDFSFKIVHNEPANTLALECTRLISQEVINSTIKTHLKNIGENSEFDIKIEGTRFICSEKDPSKSVCDLNQNAIEFMEANFGVSDRSGCSVRVFNAMRPLLEKEDKLIDMLKIPKKTMFGLRLYGNKTHNFLLAKLKALGIGVEFYPIFKD